jgi:hypothetical protein
VDQIRTRRSEFGERQRPQERRIHAEDGRIGANAERQRENGDRGESGRPPNRSYGVAKILHDSTVSRAEDAIGRFAANAA